MIKTTRAQRIALKRVYGRIVDSACQNDPVAPDWPTYRQFRCTVAGGWDCPQRHEWSRR